MAGRSDIRIAKNTVIIYVRMIVTILVGLVTSRLVLQALGASDVGIYSAVGSAVALVSIISGALTGTTVRFMNIEMGKPDGDLNRMFNVCHTTHLCGAALIFLILETLGIWYIHTQLNVPPGKAGDAMFVFQVSTVVACLNIANVPFQSLFNVHEKFGTIALVDIANTVVKLLLVLALCLFWREAPAGLRIYAVMMSAATWVSFLFYHLASRKYWPDTVRWHPVKGGSAYREVLSFSGYNLLFSSSMIARTQGSNMLINAFFSTTVNAAYFYASTLQNYVMNFVSNFDAASAPQLTQSIGAGDNGQGELLARRVCRVCLLLFLLLFFPLWSELDFLLRLWLGAGIPPDTVVMSRWSLLVAAVSVTSAGLFQLINAYGRIKWFKIESSTLFLLCLPAGYLLYRDGFPAYSILICFVVADILNRIVQFILLRALFRFDVGWFVKGAYLRPALIVLLMCVYIAAYRRLPLEGAWVHLAGFALTFLVCAALVWGIGLSRSERSRLLRHPRVVSFLKRSR